MENFPHPNYAIRKTMPSPEKIAGVSLLLNLSGYVDSLVSPTSWHSLQVACLGKHIAQMLSCNPYETQSIYWASLLHDVGKAGVPRQILSKPGPLTAEEWRVMKLHPLIGANLVRNISLGVPIVSLIQFHQERYDGSGYPDGLRGEQIPLGARIVAVVDAYDAMTSDRFYRKAFRSKKAVTEIETSSGRDFDPNVIEAFLHALYS